MKKLRLVAIGGGTGLYTLLRGLRKYDLDITAIVNMTDDGGSTGELRNEFGVLPPGDVRRCIVALSESPDSMQELFQYRFTKGSMRGHSFGNLFITALREMTGSDEQAIAEAARLLNVRGRVLPVTLDDCRLCAELENGEHIHGEANIDVPKHDGKLHIHRLYLDKPATVNPEAVNAIQEADMVVIGPGDLYGSIISNLLVDGMNEAIRTSQAKVVYICNLMTKHGETNGFMVHNFVEILERYLGKDILDYVVFSRLRLPETLREAYLKQRAEPVRFDRRAIVGHSAKFVEASLAAKGNFLRHDSRKLAQTIWALLQLKHQVKFVNY